MNDMSINQTSHGRKLLQNTLNSVDIMYKLCAAASDAGVKALH